MEIKNIEEIIEKLFDEYETCLIHIEESVKNEEYEYAAQYRDDANYILKLIKRKPLIEKLEFVVNLSFKKRIAEKIPDEEAKVQLEKYINLFWNELI